MRLFFTRIRNTQVIRRPGEKFFPGLAVFLWILLLAFPAHASSPSTAQELIERAQALDLQSDRYWHTLLHYKNTFHGLVSLIDDPKFFLAENGKHDPEAELEATLKAFFDSPQTGDQSARCRFPARYEWLTKQLDFAGDDIGASCSEFQQALKEVDPRSAVLIFPGTHNNSPASMFGHTLINIEGPYKSKLLSYAVNYSAFTDETNGFAYAVKGIFGLYRGYFSILPYYQKLREYADLERRDVWEYPLNLSAEETRRMFLHIWELRDIYSDYFFFDENCAYQLLFLLEAARPSLDLTDQTRPWVIPIDTVRIVREAGLIDSSNYRPSKATRIARIASQMNEAEQNTALAILDGALNPDQLSETPLTREGQIRVLDLATESVEFSYFKKRLTQADYRTRYLSLLRERSLLGTREDDMDWEEPVRPDFGHGSNRLSLGAGWRKGELFEQFKIRPAYHNLLDADSGYIRGSQIDFADLVLRYYSGRNSFQLYNLNLIDIVSLSPRTRFFKPISWKVRTGVKQRPGDDGKDHPVYELSPGGGFCYGNDTVLFYGMAETELLVSGRFRDSFSFGGGGSIGTLVNVKDRWKTSISGRHLWYELGERHRGTEIKLGQTLVTGASSSLILEVTRQRIYNHDVTDTSLSWNLFW